MRLGLKCFPLNRVVERLSLLSAATVLACSTSAGTPEIAQIDPDHGVPGTEVVLRGSNFGAPQRDPAVTVRFGRYTIDWRNKDPNQGFVTLWSNSEIRFLTPLLDAEPGTRVVMVHTSAGESNEVEFTVQSVCNEAQPCAAGRQAFVGAVIMQGSEQLGLLNLELIDGGTEDAALNGIRWSEDSPRRVTTVSFHVDDFETTGQDVRVDAFGNTYLALSARPVSDGLDGFDQLVMLGNGYTEFLAAFPLDPEPVRMVSRNLGPGQERNRQISVLQHGGGQIAYLNGSTDASEIVWGNVAALGPDARPDTGVYVADALHIAGHNDLSGEAWVAVVQADGGLEEIAEFRQTGVRYVDVGAYSRLTSDGVNSIRENSIYAAYNAAGSDGTSGIVRRMVTEVEGGSVSAPILSRLEFPAGLRIKAMLVDGRSTLPATTTSAARLWLTVDDVSGAQPENDFVLGIDLANDAFPRDGGSTTYAEWSAAVTSMVPAAAVEIRSGCEVCGPVVDDPFGLTLLPMAPGVTGPTFLLVANTGGDSVLAIRTDLPSGPYPDDEYSLPGSGPTRIYCMATE